MGCFSAYLSTPTAETVSLLELIENKSAPAKVMIELMTAGGEALNNLHQSGFLHRDFKLQNVVYDTKDKNIQLIGMEHAIPLAEGEISVGNFLTSPGHFHPEWWMSSRKDYIQKGVVIYTPKNDVYAYLHSAEFCLMQAMSLETEIQYQQRLYQAKSQMSDWKLKPFRHLPALEEVINCLGRLTREPQMILSDRMAGLSLHRKKIISSR